MADFHAHQFAHLGFGGQLFTHSNDPKDPCLAPPPFDEKQFTVAAIVRMQLFELAQQSWDQLGYKNGQLVRLRRCASTWQNPVSQRMDTVNLKRAWQYGLRLMVMHAESSDYICIWGALSAECPSDHDALLRQLKAAHEFEAKIAREDGGWYRIVKTPQEAREAIKAGNLAVVLGIEASNSFGCEARVTRMVNGAFPAVIGPNNFGRPNKEKALGNVCTNDDDTRDPALWRHRALAMFEEYWKLDVRHYFPIHEFDNVVGGAGLSVPTLHSVVNPTRMYPGQPFDRVSDLDRTLMTIRPPFKSWDCGDNYDFDDPDGTRTPPAGGRCNSLGLTSEGRTLIEFMADFGALIDVDHMSLKAKTEITNTETGLLGGYYPVVSGHAGLLGILHGDKRNEIQVSDADFDAITRSGGAIAPIIFPADTTTGEDTYPENTAPRHVCAQTSETFAQAYRYALARLRTSQERPAGVKKNGQPSYLGIGYGSDFHAPVASTAPRFYPPPAEWRYNNFTQMDADYFAEVKKSPSPWLKLAFVGDPVHRAPGYCYLTGATNRRGTPTPAQPAVKYPFATSRFPNKPFPKSTAPWTGDPRPYDIGYDGVAHVGLIPDFITELEAIGLTRDELTPLWHGAEAYIRTWESAQTWGAQNFNFEKPDQRAQCATNRAKLLPHVSTPSVQDEAITQLKKLNCHGARTLTQTANLKVTLVPGVVTSQCNATIEWRLDPVTLEGINGTDTAVSETTATNINVGNNACSFGWDVRGLNPGKWRLSAVSAGSPMFTPCEIDVSPPDKWYDASPLLVRCSPHVT